MRLIQFKRPEADGLTRLYAPVNALAEAHAETELALQRLEAAAAEIRATTEAIRAAEKRAIDAWENRHV